MQIDYFTHAGWRVSGRSDGANTCVEAKVEGAQVGVRNSAAPMGPTLAVPTSDWLAFLDQVAAGLVDYQALTGSVAAGPFAITRTNDGAVELTGVVTHAEQSVVRFTKIEWDVFVAGVTLDGEFTLEWLLRAPDLQT
jgi:hypothetical protein